LHTVLFADGDIEVDDCDMTAVWMIILLKVFHDDDNDDAYDDRDEDNDDGGDGIGYD
jgi:hypothetical protein